MPEHMPPVPVRVSRAGFDATRKYRYWLRREWAMPKNTVVWILLNPSTADENTDDPTIRRCIGFAKQWGFHGTVIVNLFAFRSTAPAGLLKGEPIGLENDLHIIDQCLQPGVELVMVAWGSHKSIEKILPSRAATVRGLLAKYHVQLYCLGRNKDGQPKHPLYLASSTEIERYEL